MAWAESSTLFSVYPESLLVQKDKKPHEHSYLIWQQSPHFQKLTYY